MSPTTRSSHVFREHVDTVVVRGLFCRESQDTSVMFYLISSGIFKPQIWLDVMMSFIVTAEITSDCRCLFLMICCHSWTRII